LKVAVIGANGQLGSDIVARFSDKCELVPLNHSEIEISDLDASRATLLALKPDVLINTAAYHNVPRCEEDPQKSFEINGLGALNLAKLSEEQDFKLVHFSTDYVFDGLKMQPYLESDPVNPLNVYAITKQAGENFVRNYCDKHFIIRVAGIYGKTPCRAKGGNFIDTMVRLAGSKPKVTVVNDEILTPTSTEEIAHNTFELIQTDAYDLYHMTAQDAVSWYEFHHLLP